LIPFSLHQVLLWLDPEYFNTDKNFSTTHDSLVAKILANQMLRNFIDAKLCNRQNPRELPQLTWTAPKVAMIELIYALHSGGFFSNGRATLKDLIETFERAFEIKLGQYSRIFLELRARKLDRTRFLDSLKTFLIKRMDEADK
jgi:phosphatidylserine/phosphatidylglycerophosphate/cardiolipin synthase-like enzyme